MIGWPGCSASTASTASCTPSASASAITRPGPAGGGSGLSPVGRSASPTGRSGTTGGVLLVIAVVLGLLVYVNYGRDGGSGSNQAANIPANLLGGDGDASSGAIHLEGGQPPAGLEEADAPRGQPAVTTSVGPHTFIEVQPDGEGPGRATTRAARSTTWSTRPTLRPTAGTSSPPRWPRSPPRPGSSSSSTAPPTRSTATNERPINPIATPTGGPPC